MVDKSDLVIAVLNGSNGGTKKTIDFDRLMKKEIILIEIKKGTDD